MLVRSKKKVHEIRCWIESKITYLEIKDFKKMWDMLLELRVEERKNRGGHLGGIFFFLPLTIL